MAEPTPGERRRRERRIGWSDPPGTAPDVRFSYANERTFLAWNRTALAMITAGLAVTQLLPPFQVGFGRRVIGLPLIGVGIVISVGSFVQWRRNEHAMRMREPLPRSILPPLVAVAVAVSAVVALTLELTGNGAE